MSGGAAASSPRTGTRDLRRLATVAAGILCVTATVPQLGHAIAHDEVVATLQFSVLAMVVPALLVLGAPWRSFARPGRNRASGLDRALVQLDARRRAHPGLARSGSFLALDVAVMVAWRMPVLVDAVARTGALAVVESACLVAAGMLLWLELVESPPLEPRSSKPRRAVLAALAMWSVWTVAYIEAMSGSDWYTAFRHVAGSGLSAAADRQMSAGVLWAVSAAAFMPVVFWNLFAWLGNEGARDDGRGADLALARRASAESRDSATPASA